MKNSKYLIQENIQKNNGRYSVALENIYEIREIYMRYVKYILNFQKYFKKGDNYEKYF